MVMWGEGGETQARCRRMTDGMHNSGSIAHSCVWQHREKTSVKQMRAACTALCT